LTAPARAFVLGGGVAGLCAAFGLRDRGLQVRLLEAHGWLGGRVCSFRDRRTGVLFDNGPHVLLGCYRAMRALLARLHSEHRFAVGNGLRVAYRCAGGRSARLRLPGLPVPLALPPALLLLPLGAGGRLRALWGLWSALRGAPPSWTLQQWIDRKGQRGAPAAFFWTPLCRAIMNVEPAAASAALFLRTLRAAFGGRAAAGALWAPVQPWGELVGAAAERQLQQEGIAVHKGARITGLVLDGGLVTALRLGDGTAITVTAADTVVSALPWHALAPLLDPPAPPFARLQPSPLVTIHFELAGGAVPPPDDGPLVVLVDGEPFHFLYRTPGAPPGRFALLAGGNRALDGLPVLEIERLARAQLVRYYPQFDSAVPAGTRVAKEARATFIAAPAALAARPRPGRLPGGPRNLLVCGDWTDCGLPATLEGAARSAELLLAGIAPAPPLR